MEAGRREVEGGRRETEVYESSIFEVVKVSLSQSVSEKKNTPRKLAGQTHTHSYTHTHTHTHTCLSVHTQLSLLAEHS